MPTTLGPVKTQSLLSALPLSACCSGLYRHLRILEVVLGTVGVPFDLGLVHLQQFDVLWANNRDKKTLSLSLSLHTIHSRGGEFIAIEVES